MDAAGVLVSYVYSSAMKSPSSKFSSAMFPCMAGGRSASRATVSSSSSTVGSMGNGIVPIESVPASKLVCCAIVSANFLASKALFFDSFFRSLLRNPPDRVCACRIESAGF